MTTPASGNRWEPAAGATPEVTAPPYGDHPPVEPTAAPPSRARVPRLRLWLVTLGAAFLLVGGVGGFVIGHAAADHGAGTGQVGPAGDGDPRHGFGPGDGHDPFDGGDR